jgi:hypothetical protein
VRANKKRDTNSNHLQGESIPQDLLSKLKWFQSMAASVIAEHFEEQVGVLEEANKVDIPFHFSKLTMYQEAVLAMFQEIRYCTLVVIDNLQGFLYGLSDEEHSLALSFLDSLFLDPQSECHFVISGSWH